MTAALLVGVAAQLPKESPVADKRRLSGTSFLLDFSRRSTKAPKALFAGGGSLLRRKRRTGAAVTPQSGGDAETDAESIITPQNAQQTMHDLPEALWRRICTHLGPLDRMRLAACSRRMRDAVGAPRSWSDVRALELRADAAPAIAATHAATDEVVSLHSPPSLLNSPRRRLCSASASASSLLAAALPFRRRAAAVAAAAKRRASLPKECGDNGTVAGDALRRPLAAFRVRLTLVSGACYSIRTDVTVATVSGDCTDAQRIADASLCALLARISGDALRELTIRDACLTERHRAALYAPHLRTLRLWNCARYLREEGSDAYSAADSAASPLPALLALPSLRQLLVLDSVTPESAADDAPTSGEPVFHKALARAINAPLEELQLTACRLPLRSLQLLRERCAPSLRRLSIGCVWGKCRKRAAYLRELGAFRALADLDLPPFLFRLGDHPAPDPAVQSLLAPESLPRLRALGFRHFNSAALFRFIESLALPARIRLLRVHHSAHRVPNFAELGHPPPPPVVSSPRASCPNSARACGSILFGGAYGNGSGIHTGIGSPDSHRNPPPPKKFSIGSQRSSLLSSSRSSFRSESMCQPPYPRSATISTGIVDYGTPTEPPAATVTYDTAERSVSVSCSASSSSSGSSASSTTSSRCRLHQCRRSPPPPNNRRSPPYRGKSFSLGAEAASATDAASMATSSTWCSLATTTATKVLAGEQSPTSTPRESVAERLARRHLTILAVAEERIIGGAGGGDAERRRAAKHAARRARLRKCTYAGVQVIYVAPAEAQRSQEVLGRMGSPIQSPFVYTAGSAAGSAADSAACEHTTAPAAMVRVVRGDIVRAIPLSALGMESDYDEEESEEEYAEE